MWSRDIEVPHQQILPRSDKLKHLGPRGREPRRCFHIVSLRVAHILNAQILGRYRAGSIVTWYLVKIKCLHFHNGTVTLLDKIGGDTRWRTASADNSEMEALLRTGEVFTQWRGVLNRLRSNIRPETRPKLARQSAWLLPSQVSWALTLEKFNRPLWAWRRKRRCWNIVE